MAPIWPEVVCLLVRSCAHDVGGMSRDTVDCMTVPSGHHSRLINFVGLVHGLLDDSGVEDGRLQRVSMPCSVGHVDSSNLVASSLCSLGTSLFWPLHRFGQ